LGSSFGIATGSRLDRGLISGRGWEFFPSPQHANWLWSSRSLLSSGWIPELFSTGIKWPGA